MGAVGSEESYQTLNVFKITDMDPADNDYWAWREENDRVIQQQAEAQQWYGEYRETCEKRDALDAAFTAAGELPVATTRRIRLTEAL